MKRFILFYSFFTFCLLMVEANPISKAQALQEAKEFLSSKGIVMQTTDEAYKAPRKANSKDANPYYYIYNVGNDNGFVIVSGDDRTKKILGYVDSGNFDEDNVPAPLKEWLRGYEREIESLSTIELLSTSPKRKVIEKTKKAIPPMT
ncbi:MAG: Spi family protease inhibitor, partial [Prevotella sp.]|nr:Spi family protease inhibitor [Prevotella sp.]